jgi:hypothetical protein
MVRAFIEETNTARPAGLDWTGQLSVSLSLWSLTTRLIEAGNVGWTAPRVLAAFAIALALAALGVTTQRRSASPVFPPALFSRPAFVACVAAGIVISLACTSILFVVSIYLQNGPSPERARDRGAMIVPLTVMPTVTTRLIDRYRGDMHFKPRLVADRSSHCPARH